MVQNLIPFVGRQTELTELSQMIADPACHLITLVGPGGIGKTRLATEVAAQCEHLFTDGAFFVDLQPVSETEHIVLAIASVIGCGFAENEEPRKQLLDYLRHKSAFIVLDNFEQLLSGVDLLVDIAETAPAIMLLVTSREIMNLRMEWVFELQGLSIPVNELADDVESYDAVRLFAEHARRLIRNFSLSAEAQDVINICRLTEGMPLAIELATSWLRTLSAQEIASELAKDTGLLQTNLRDVPDRHRSLRMVFEQTWQRLSVDERDVFEKLSVFRGGFLREAATIIAGASLQSLISLMDKILLRSDDTGRYSIHELLRQFGEEKLGESPQLRDAVNDRHCDYYAEFLHEREYGIWSGWDGEDEVLQEIENIRKAWLWAVKQGQLKQISDMIIGLYFTYELQGWWSDFVVLCQSAADELKAAEPDSGTSHICALLQSFQGIYLRSTGHEIEGKTLLLKSLDILRSLEPGRELAWMPANLHHNHRMPGNAIDDPAEMVALAKQAVSIFRQLNDQTGYRYMPLVLGNLLMDHGDYDTAETHFLQQLEVVQEINSYRSIAWVQFNLAELAIIRGNLENARKYISETYRYILKAESGVRLLYYSNILGEFFREIGDLEAAKHHYLKVIEGTQDYSSLIHWRLSAIAGLAEISIAEAAYQEAAELLLSVQPHASEYPEISQEVESLLLQIHIALPEFDSAREKYAYELDLETTCRRLLNEYRDQLTDPVGDDARTLPNALTERELDVLMLIAGGLSNQQIADDLVVGLSTVKKHINHIYSKLGVARRTQALSIAREIGLID